jgi:hypothetical protein
MYHPILLEIPSHGLTEHGSFFYFDELQSNNFQSMSVCWEEIEAIQQWNCENDDSQSTIGESRFNTGCWDREEEELSRAALDIISELELHLDETISMEHFGQWLDELESEEMIKQDMIENANFLMLDREDEVCRMIENEMEEDETLFGRCEYTAGEYSTFEMYITSTDPEFLFEQDPFEAPHPEVPCEYPFPVVWPPQPKLTEREKTEQFIIHSWKLTRRYSQYCRFLEMRVTKMVAEFQQRKNDYFRYWRIPIHKYNLRYLHCQAPCDKTENWSTREGHFVKFPKFLYPYKKERLAMIDPPTRMYILFVRVRCILKFCQVITRDLERLFIRDHDGNCCLYYQFVRDDYIKPHSNWPWYLTFTPTFPCERDITRGNSRSVSECRRCIVRNGMEDIKKEIERIRRLVLCQDSSPFETPGVREYINHWKGRNYRRLPTSEDKCN